MDRSVKEETYSSKPGAIDQGTDYEFKMLALMVLRCVEGETENFSFAFNANGCGKFDDLVVYRKIGEREYVVSLVQLKHQTTPKVLKSEDFLREKGDFSLSAYARSYKELQGTNLLTLNSMFPIDISFDNIELVLYTNRDIDASTGGCTFLNDCTQHNNFLFTSGRVYTFNESNRYLQSYPKPFLKKLYLFAKQVDVSTVDGLIKDEIERIVPNTKIDSNFLNNFMQFVTCWGKGELGGHYTLTKNRIIVELTELLLNSFIHKYYAIRNVVPEVREEIIQIVEKIIASGDILLVSMCDDRKMDFLRIYLNRRIDNLSETFENIRFERLKVRVRDDTTAYRALWRLGRVPLFLFVENDDECSFVTNILNRLKCKAKFIIVSKNVELNRAHFDEGFKILTNLNDLDNTLQNFILNCDVTLQGRGPLKLNEVVSQIPECIRFISINDIICILNGDFIIGDPLTTLPDFYVARKIPKLFFNPQLLTVTRQNAFGFVCNDIQKCRDFLNQTRFNLMHILFDDPEKINFNLATKILHYDTHYLRFDADNNRFEWLKSCGSVEEIRNHLSDVSEDTRCYSLDPSAPQNDISTEFPRLVNIISGEPGIGKSVVMSAIALQTPITKWVLRVDLNKYMDYFHDLRSEHNSVTYIKYFNSALFERLQCDNDFNKMVFEHYLEKKKILLLFDGFDEVVPGFTNCVTQIIRSMQDSQYPVWLTTRPVMQEHAEQQFDTFANILKPFNKEDQFDFLSKYFTAHCPTEFKNRITNFVEKLLLSVHSHLGNNLLSLMGIPLQSYMLAAVYRGDCQNYLETENFILEGKLDVLSLYEKFIVLKENEFSGKYPGGNSLNQIHSSREYHSLYALTILFQNEDLSDIQATLDYFTTDVYRGGNKFGIIVLQADKNLAFIHRSFAEYYAAIWLAQNFENDKYKNLAITLIKKLIEPDYQLVASFFDRYVTKDLPLHMAVLNFNLKEVQAVINENTDEVISKTDKLGRNALCMYSLWGIQLYNDNDYGNNVVGNNIENDTSVKIAIMDLISKNINFNLADDIGGRNALHVAASKNHNKLVEFLISDRMNVSETDFSGQNALHIAAWCGSEKVFEVLLSSKIDIEATDKEGKNALHLASIRGHGKIVDILLSKTININAVDSEGNNALFYAVNENYQEIMKMILRNAIDISSTDNVNKVALHYAAKKGFKQIIEILLLRNDNIINSTDKLGKNALHHGACQGFIEIVELLILNGADINSVDRDGNNALHFASGKNYKEIAEMLISRGLDMKLTNKHGENALHCAARNGSEKTAELLISEGIDLHSVDRNGKNVLHIAAELGHENIIDILLLKNVNTNLLDGEGNNALLYAIKEGYKRIAEILISKEVDISSTDVLDEIILHYAAENGFKNIMEILLSEGIDINSRDKYRKSALHHAAHKGFIEIVKLLIYNETIDIEATDVQNKNALHYAAEKGNTEIVEILLKRMNVSSIDKFGRNIIHYAIWSGSKEMVELVMSYLTDNDLNAIDKDGKNALHFVSENGSIEIAELLISKNIDINSLDAENKNALCYAIQRGDTKMVEWLLLKKINVNSTDEIGKYALHYAAEKGSKEIVDMILLKGVDINFLDNKNKSVLHYAAFGGSKELVEELLLKQININSINKNGRNALHFAAKSGFKEIAELLITNGVEKNLLDGKGKNALHYAAENGFIETVELLIRSGIAMNSTASDGKIVLHLAADKGLKEMVAWLVENKVDVNLTDVNQRTALHYAAKGGYKDIVESILSKDINGINLLDKQHKTALHYAVESGSIEVVKILRQKGVNIFVRDKRGNNALYFAILKGFHEIVNLLSN